MIELNLPVRGITSRIYVGGRLNDSSAFFRDRDIFILADENVIRYHHDSFPDLPVISIRSGERAKSMDNIMEIYRELLKYEVDRSSAIIGIGGGITTDVTGFVASTYMRGIPFGFVATTLLSQVDAAIGGKNGINLDGYKNMIGVIRQPEFVICDTYTLTTLEKNEFIGGFSEIIKYGAIRNISLFSYLEENMEKGLNMDMDVLQKLITESVKVKTMIVMKDELETGERKILNFGHTFAHSLEKLYKIPHGEAVAAGMILAARVSENLGMLQHSQTQRLTNLIRRTGLPVHLDYDPDDLSDTMKKDKKRAGSEIRFILLEKIGKAVVKDIKINEIKSILYDLR